VRRPQALIVLALGTLDFALEQTIVAPALPALEQHFRSSPTSAIWLLTGYVLAAAVAMPLAGRLGDQYGHRRLLLWSLGAFAIGSLVAALASTIGVLIAGRVIQGLGAGTGPLAVAVIRRQVRPEQLPQAVGLLVASGSVGATAGLLLAGPLTDHVSKSAIFWLLLIVACALALAVWLAVDETADRISGRIDVLGAALLAGGLGCAMLAISRAGDWGWGSARTVVLLAVAVAGLAAFVWRERSAAEPLIPWTTLCRRSMWSANLAMAAIGFSILIGLALVPLIGGYPKLTGYGLGLSTTSVGLLLVPSSLATLIAGPLGGRLIKWMGARRQALLGTACATASYVLLATLHRTELAVILAMIPLGLGIGLALGAITNLVVSATTPEQTGATVGLNTVIRSVAAALGVQIATAIVTGTHGIIPILPADSGFTAAFVMSAIAMAVAVGAVLLMPGVAEDQAAARRSRG
jgi:EmrB/QacA subfamily drug resistance transporter